MLRSAGRYESPLALDCGTGTAAVRDQGSSSQHSRSMWSRDKNASPINWLLLRHQPASSTTYNTSANTSSTSRPQKCHLTETLPYELREMILLHCLPHTISYRGGTAWCKGSMSILRTNKQLYAEGTALLYHTNTFSLDVIYDCSYFAMTWLTPTSDPARVLHVRRQRAFPECLSARNVPKIRRLEITVRHVDSYTGMIKYGYGGGGLTEGLRMQVTFLCQVLRTLPVIDCLEVSYQCQDVRRKGETQGVLDPFLALVNVREVRTSGHVLEETAGRLRARLAEAREREVRLLQGEEQEREEGPELEEKQMVDSAGLDTTSKQPGEKPAMRSLASYRGYDDRDI